MTVPDAEQPAGAGAVAAVGGEQRLRVDLEADIGRGRDIAGERRLGDPHAGLVPEQQAAGFGRGGSGGEAQHRLGRGGGQHCS